MPAIKYAVTLGNLSNLVKRVIKKPQIKITPMEMIALAVLLTSQSV